MNPGTNPAHAPPIRPPSPGPEQPAKPTPRPKPKPRRLRWLAGPAVGAGATIAAALITLLAAPNASVSVWNVSLGQQPTQTASSTVTATVTPPAVTVTAPAPAPTEPAATAQPASGPPAGTTLLTKRDLVEDDSYSNYENGAYKIDGTLYPDSFSYSLEPCNESGDQAFTGWDLAGEFETLHTVIGLRGDSNPETEAKFTFIGDGHELKSITVKWKQHETLDLDVTGVLRLQVKVATVAESAGGDCRGWAYPSWGQPYLTSS
ncbi:NPCBM/NEW2 domain-containing protein [Flindersiella endophytica]